jgi:hypothetical protein
MKPGSTIFTIAIPIYDFNGIPVPEIKWRFEITSGGLANPPVKSR